MKLLSHLTTLFILALVFVSCDQSSSVNDLNEPKEQRAGELRVPDITITAKLHRAKVTTNSGKTCDCAACFGICDGQVLTFGTISSDQWHIDIIEEGNDVYLYLLEPVTHSESNFVIDEDIDLVVYESDEYVDRTLKAGTYAFEVEGVDYTDSGTTTYGRININVE